MHEPSHVHTSKPCWHPRAYSTEQEYSVQVPKGSSHNRIRSHLVHNLAYNLQPHLRSRSLAKRLSSRPRRSPLSSKHIPLCEAERQFSYIHQLPPSHRSYSLKKSCLRPADTNGEGFSAEAEAAGCLAAELKNNRLMSKMEVSPVWHLRICYVQLFSKYKRCFLRAISLRCCASRFDILPSDFTASP